MCAEASPINPQVQRRCETECELIRSVNLMMRTHFSLAWIEECSSLMVIGDISLAGEIPVRRRENERPHRRPPANSRAINVMLLASL